jgi:hypothetical protein
MSGTSDLTLPLDCSFRLSRIRQAWQELPPGQEPSAAFATDQRTILKDQRLTAFALCYDG